METVEAPRTILTYPPCPACKLNSGVMKGKYKEPWFCTYCKQGFDIDKETDVTEKALIVTNHLAPTTFAEAKLFAEMICKTDFVPSGFKGNPGAVLAAIQFGAEVGLAPLASLQNIAVINGKPSLYGDAPLAICMAHPLWGGITETGDDKTATCSVNRKGNPSPFTVTFSKTDAEASGLWGKPGPWKSYPRRMLQMRARGFALRDAFPDALKGLITREEAEDYPALKIINEPEPPPPAQTEEQRSGPSAPVTQGAAAPPSGKPMPPADPNEGEKGIMPDAWVAVTDAMYAAKDLKELAATYKAAVRMHENEATDEQMQVLVSYKNQLKDYVGEV